MLEPVTNTGIILPLHSSGRQAPPLVQLADPTCLDTLRHPSPIPLSARGLPPTRKSYLVRQSLFPRRASLSPRLHQRSSEPLLLSPRQSVGHIPSNPGKLAQAAQQTIGLRARSPTNCVASAPAPPAPAPVQTNASATNGYIRPVAVDSQSTPRLHNGQVHSQSREPLTLMHPVPRAPSPVGSPGRCYCQVASPYRAFRAGPDTLAQQLQALQEAKKMAAAQQVESEQMIAQRQDQLRRETYKALCGSALSEDVSPEVATRSLAQTVRQWPLPEKPWHADCDRGEVAALHQASEDSADQVPEELPSESRSISPLRDYRDPSSPEDSLPEATEPASAGPKAMERAKVISPSASIPAHKSSGRVSIGRTGRPAPLYLPQEDVHRCSHELKTIAQGISTIHLRELRMLKRPPAAVVTVLEALKVILGEGQTGGFKKLLSDSLPQRLETFDPSSLNTQQASKLKSLLGSGTIHAESMSKMCQPCTNLTKWCDCIYGLLLGEVRDGSRHLTEEVMGRRNTDSSNSHGTRSHTDLHDRQTSRHAGLLHVEPDLSKLSKEELASVHELTVTKPGIGSVLFHGVTDCTDLDIQSDIVLKRGYVLVYPDASRKPPVGQGLNKRATVTMYQCFPPGERVEDKQVLEEYRTKIKIMTEENRACKFIDYDCLTGVWTFEVGRF
ncbi:NUP98B [Symbiodinium necroappetens]|uniref:NUP98B protein n=1 Tax=Symbiodinium necroappetens TaxID=1628268 RepID=A0A813CFA7_9DINO|nr:NUP98B [Symbiodinium necroappetens]